MTEGLGGPLVDVVRIDENRSVLVAPLELREGEPSKLERLALEAGAELAVAVNWRVVASARHAAMAARRALRSFEAGAAIGKTLRTEFLVCLTGTRQVSRAINLARPKGDRCTLVCVVRDPSRVLERLHSLKAVRVDYPDALDVLESLGAGSIAGGTCTGSLEALVMEASARVELDR